MNVWTKQDCKQCQCFHNRTLTLKSEKNVLTSQGGY